MHLLIVLEGVPEPPPPRRYPPTPASLITLAKDLQAFREAEKRKNPDATVYVATDEGIRIPQEDLDYVLYGDKPPKERPMSRTRRPDQRRLQPRQAERAAEVLKGLVA